MCPFQHVIRPLLLALLACAVLLPGTAARAHDAGEARLSVWTDGPQIRVELALARIDALDLLGLTPEAAPADPALFDAVARALPDWIVIESADPCPWTVGPVTPAGLRGLTLTATSQCPGARGIDWRAARHPRLSLRAVGTLTRDGVGQPFTLGRVDSALPLSPEGPRTGLGFVLSGVEHILIGWDHLAFLLAILLGCGSVRRVIAVVSAFTVAHSITLALGATGVLVLPSGPVEAVIAASIACAAAMGLWRWRAGRLDHPGRASVAGDTPGIGGAVTVCFAFGLVHGLGFAGLLADMLPADAGLLVPLLAFNVGVELGQIAVVALLFPVLAALGRRPSTRQAVPALLSGLLALGVVVAGLRAAG